MTASGTDLIAAVPHNLLIGLHGDVADVTVVDLTHDSRLVGPGWAFACVPGEQPLLCFHQPADYWHRPPARPESPWTSHWRIEVLRDAGAARKILPLDGRRVALIGEPREYFAACGLKILSVWGMLSPESGLRIRAEALDF